MTIWFKYIIGLIISHYIPKCASCSPSTKMGNNRPIDGRFNPYVTEYLSLSQLIIYVLDAFYASFWLHLNSLCITAFIATFLV
uniref:Uncharacterized protein n=1 Tax=Lactuca sativa TaxID=4236 RepID=A0A9R1UKF0_LACSA|nr:hypothetical protein LSAT_V11C800430370 [Lactuca sativa]